MDFKKIIFRGLLLAVIIVLIACVGMGIIDIVVFGVIALLVIIAASVATIAHNQKVDKE